jgi:hypothetical protein
MVRVARVGGLHTSLIVSTPAQAIHRSLPVERRQRSR